MSSYIETRFAKDLADVLAWVDGGPEPTTVKDAGFRADRLDTMTSRLSAAYKGIHALLMNKGARDFRSGQPFNQATYFDEAVDIHHIFPRAWCTRAQIPRERFDTIINKTPLSYKTNRVVGGDAPSVYLAKLPRQGGASHFEIDEHLKSHLIEPELLHRDDFDAFVKQRRESLLSLIESAIGKPIYRGTGSDEPTNDTLPDDEEAMLDAAQ